VAVLFGASVPAATAPAGAPAPYYLSLGDSLAQGVQPTVRGRSVETSDGYADDIYATYRHLVRGLRLEKLGCPGETTTSMINGGICQYGAGSQLAQAVAFLQTHTVRLITLDIGANDVDSCVVDARADPACVAAGTAAAGAGLPTIVSELRAAAGPGVPIVAMDYYDPFLPVWLEGAAGRELAHESVQAAEAFNRLIDGVYRAAGVPVADVEGAFGTSTFTPVAAGLPRNVAEVCALTWACTPPPVGPNIHANAAGYWVIALAFLPKIGFL
jgi:lysophospholipase L1-like esterase